MHDVGEAGLKPVSARDELLESTSVNEVVQP